MVLAVQLNVVYCYQELLTHLQTIRIILLLMPEIKTINLRGITTITTACSKKNSPATREREREIKKLKN